MPDFFAPCPRGLEKLLADELASFGAAEVNHRWRCAFSGDWPLCYRANLESRIASRILWRVKETRYRSEQDIYKAAFDLQWQRWFDVSHTIRVNITAIKLSAEKPGVHHAADQGCGVRQLPRALQRAPQRGHAGTRTCASTCSSRTTSLMLYLDTSGDALFKRGVRSHTNIAPLRENLAAGILRLAGWQPGMPLLDPMCGSGTFLIEAAQMSLNIQPGIARSFAFEKLKNFDAPLWNEHARSRRSPRNCRSSRWPIYGSDLYGDALKAAARNLEEAGSVGMRGTETGQRAGNLRPRRARHTGREPALRRAHG